MTRVTKPLLPCPHCGTVMHQHEHCFSHPMPIKGDCILRHYSFGNEKVEDWNRRWVAGWGHELKDTPQ